MDDLNSGRKSLDDFKREGERKVSPPPEANFVCVDDVQREEIRWAWPNRIPLGKVTLICGDPGGGKSHATTDIAARITQEFGVWPDGEVIENNGSVILFSAEDDTSDTIRPRLERAGADLKKVFILESVKVWDHRSQEMRHSAFCLGEHVPLLQQMVEKIGDVRLIVIDPISSYTGKVDSHKNAEVRAMLTELVAMAAKHGIAVVVVTHLSKGSGGKAVYRATGSLAFAAAARVVLMLARDLDDPNRRLLLPVKCNIAPELAGLAFTIKSDAGGSFVAWEADPVQMTADGYLADEMKKQQTQSKDGDASELARAVDFIKKQLASGPMLTTELVAAIKANDIANATFRRAKGQLEIRADKEHGKNKPWWTLLPGQTIPKPGNREGAQTSNPEHHEHIEHVEHLPFEREKEEQNATLVEGAQGAQGVHVAQGMDGEHLPNGKRAKKSKPTGGRPA